MVENMLMHYIKMAEYSEFIYNGNSGILIVLAIIIIFAITGIYVAGSVVDKNTMSIEHLFVCAVSLTISALIIYHYVSVPKPVYYYLMAHKVLVENNLTSDPSYSKLKYQIEKYIELDNEYIKKLNEEVVSRGRAYYDKSVKF